jgi:hypothetical protein
MPDYFYYLSEMPIVKSKKISKLSLFVFLLLVPIFFTKAGNPENSQGRVDELYSKCIMDSVPDPNWKGNYLHVFRPDSISGHCPVIIFCPTFTSEHTSEYMEFIEHNVNSGYALIFLSARKISITRNKITKYDLGIEAIENVFRKYAQFDTSRIGVIGHGFGAGAVPALTRNLLMKNWGQNGSFMYLMSPWYLYSTNERELKDFPGNITMLVVQSFENDNYNDPAIGADIFNLIGIDSLKKYYLHTSDFKIDGHKYKADFNLPLGEQATLGSFNLLDTVAFFKVADNLERCCFSNDSLFFNVNIRNHRSSFKNEISMSGNKSSEKFSPLIISNKPVMPSGKHLYVNNWNSWRNPRLNTTQFREKSTLFFSYNFKKINDVSRYILKSAFSFFHSGKDGDEDFDDKKTIVSQNPISQGYGSDGHYKTELDTFRNPLDPKITVSTFFPKKYDSPAPVVFFLHGYNGGNPEYFDCLINNLVSRGYAVVFSPYPIFPTVDKKENIKPKIDIAMSGFEYAVKRYKSRLDTSRIAFFGHSFGGGITPGIAYKMVMNKGWGKAGSCMFISAPWYVYGITTDQLKNFPSNVKLLVVTYSDDTFNDHQMAVDLFKTISIPASEKDYCTFFSDTCDGIKFEANHFVPYGPLNINGALDNFDYYGIFKLFDALLDYSLAGNEKAKVTALGNGSESQCYMGTDSHGRKLKPVCVTDDPHAVVSELNYLFAWENNLNPRLHSTKN